MVEQIPAMKGGEVPVETRPSEMEAIAEGQARSQRLLQPSTSCAWFLSKGHRKAVRSV